MTILDVFRNGSIEEVADYVAICNDELFQYDIDCPCECKYLEQGYEYEDDDWNGSDWHGYCLLSNSFSGPSAEECPYKINRKEVFMKQVFDWLNTPIKES